jgi:hypothetical protein
MTLSRNDFGTLALWDKVVVISRVTCGSEKSRVAHMPM